MSTTTTTTTVANATNTTVLEMMEEFRLGSGDESPLLPGNVRKYAEKFVAQVMAPRQFTNPEEVLTAIKSMREYHQREGHDVDIPGNAPWNSYEFAEEYSLRDLVREASAELEIVIDDDDESVYSDDLSADDSEDDFLETELDAWKQVFDSDDSIQDMLDRIVMVIECEDNKLKQRASEAWDDVAIACMHAYGTLVKGCFRMIHLLDLLEGDFRQDPELDVLMEQLEQEYQVTLARLYAHVFLDCTGVTNADRVLTKEECDKLDAWMERNFPGLVGEAEPIENPRASANASWATIYNWFQGSDVPNVVETHTAVLQANECPIPEARRKLAIEACESIKSLYKLVDVGHRVWEGRQWDSACDTMDKLMELERSMVKIQKPLARQDSMPEVQPGLTRKDTYVRAIQGFAPTAVES